MFKAGLLVTTTLVVAGSLSLLAAQSWAQPVSGGLSRDRNRDFLCTYGAVAVSSFVASSSGTGYSRWTHYATPITGKGKTVSRIVLREKTDPAASSPDFSAGIYSNTASGLPGKLIAGGTAKGPAGCRKVEVSIPPTNLKSGKTYWIEETVPRPVFNGFASSVVNEAFWAQRPKSRRKAYRQYHVSYSDHLHSSTTPWTAQAKDVYAKAE